MLIEFSVENYRSFKDKATLSMVASGRDRSLPGNVIHSAQGSHLDLIKSVAVYGPNASGKSNLFQAMRFMSSFVRNSAEAHRKDADIRISPFKLDASRRLKPSTFEVIFLCDGVRYEYGFSADASRVHHEWLVAYPQRQPRLLFERMKKQFNNEYLYRFSPSWRGEKKKLVRSTPPNALLLSTAASDDQDIAVVLLDWFSRFNMFYSKFWSEFQTQEFVKKVLMEDESIKGEVIKLLSYADLGIDDFLLEKKPFRDSSLYDKLPDAVRDLIIESSPEALYGEAYEIFTIHRGKSADGSDDEVIFSFDEESEGTRRFFNLSIPCIWALRGSLILALDEFESSLHPLLTHWIMNKFHGTTSNPNGSQLIAMTHDASLLEADMFRRDQVWFTEKSPEGATELFSLGEFRKLTRRDENIRKNYLSGRYGAIPFLTEPEYES